MTKNTISGAVFCSIAFAAVTMFWTCARATDITSGTGVLVSLHQCTDDTCDGAYSRYAYQEPANPGDPSSSTSLNDSSGNSVFAMATLGNATTDGAPILRASSTSTAGNYNIASAAALQSYTWNGTGPATLTFGGTLTFSQTMTSGTVGPPGVGAAIQIFTLATGQSFDAGTSPSDNMNALLGLTTQSGLQSLGSSQYQFAAATAASTGSASVTITLQQGVTYWVDAILQAASTNGGASDASHTFVTQWSNSVGLTAATVTAAPEIDPATTSTPLVFLFGSLAVLRGRRDYRPHVFVCNKPAG